MAYKIQLPGYKIGMRKLGDALDFTSGEYLMNIIDMTMYFLRKEGINEGIQESFCLAPAIDDLEDVNSTFLTPFTIEEKIKSIARRLKGIFTYSNSGNLRELEEIPTGIVKWFGISQYIGLRYGISKGKPSSHARDDIEKIFDITKIIETEIENAVDSVLALTGRA